MWHRFFSDQDLGFWRFWSQTRVFFGFDCVNRIPEVLDGLGIENVLLVTDSGVSKLKFLKGIVERLENYIDLVEHIGWESDYGDVVSISAKALSRKVEAVIAVGGGSVLDGAKLVAVLARNPETPEKLKLLHTVNEHPLPLICVPTTFGTGSEVNMYSHLRKESSEKIAYKKDFLTPTAAFVDPGVAFETPVDLRMLSAVDAVCHSLEVLSLKRERSPIQEALALYGLRLLTDHFDDYISHPDNTSASAVALASLIGGICIHNSRTGLVHTLASSYARVSSLPHTVSLLPFLGIFFDELKQWLLEKVGKELMESVEKVMGVVRGRIGEGLYLRTLNDEARKIMVDYCIKDVVLLKENPFKLTPERVEELYAKYLGW